MELRAATLVAATAAHEINNPLAVVIGSLDLLARQLPPTGRERQLVDRAVKAGERIRDIVARLTKIRRIEEGAGGENVPTIIDLQRSTEPSEDPQWKRFSTPSSS
jgi:signal transduction histidine kinase